ncbi:MAG: hypothetical protein AAGC46_16620 [Solirubrobacteraceae bacterium]|nr:hypothetical protein [Patulibacter sp.]
MLPRLVWSFPLSLVAAAAVAMPAHATGVAYVDGGQVWVASSDGTSKHQLSQTVGSDAWNTVAQSDTGSIVGVRNQPGKIATLSSFEVWNPDGMSNGVGPLTAESGWSTTSYPVGLDLTADGKTIVYGYSNTRNFGSTLETGTYLLSTANRSTNAPVKLAGHMWPTLVSGNRLLTTPNQRSSELQDTGAQPPFVQTFKGWGVGGLSGYDTHRTKVSADGKVLASEFVKYAQSSTTVDDSKIAVFPITSAGGDIDDVHSCFLPTQGSASSVSIAQDSSLIAWKDDRGVVVAPRPAFIGTGIAQVCELSTPPVVISATGSFPSLGPFDAKRLDPVPAGGGTGGGGSTGTTTPTPGTGTGTTPGGTATTATPSTAGTPANPLPAATLKSATLSQLRTGLSLTVNATRKGTVSVTLTVPAGKVGLKGKARTIATGSTKAKGKGKVRLTLKANALGKAKAAKLAGVKATLRITIAGKTTTRTVTLG